MSVLPLKRLGISHIYIFKGTFRIGKTNYDIPHQCFMFRTLICFDAISWNFWKFAIDYPFPLCPVEITAVCKKWRHIRRNLTAAAMAPILNAWETGPRGILGLSINDYHVTIIIWKGGFKMSTILGFLFGMTTTYKRLLVGLFNI